MHALYRGNFIRMLVSGLRDNKSLLTAINESVQNPIIMDDYDAGYHNGIGDVIRALEEYAGSSPDFFIVPNWEYAYNHR